MSNLTPPNLRTTTILIAGDVPKSCGNCIEFFKGSCRLFPAWGRIKANQVCDEWSGK